MKVGHKSCNGDKIPGAVMGGLLTDSRSALSHPSARRQLLVFSIKQYNRFLDMIIVPYKSTFIYPFIYKSSNVVVTASQYSYNLQQAKI